MSNSQDIATQAVENSAELLNQYYWCSVWEDEINIDTLCMSSSVDCILGQLFGDYHAGCRKLGISTCSSDEFAFTAGRSFSFSEAYNAWKSYLEGDVMNSYNMVANNNDSNTLARVTALVDYENNSVLLLTQNRVELAAAEKALDAAGVAYTRMVEEV